MSTPPESPEESPNFFDERFDFEEPYDLLESAEVALRSDRADRGRSRAAKQASPSAASPTTRWRR